MSFMRLKSRCCWAALLEAPRKNFFPCLFHLLKAACVPWLLGPHHPDFCFRVHIFSDPDPLAFLLQGPPWLYWAYLDNLGYSHISRPLIYHIFKVPFLTHKGSLFSFQGLVHHTSGDIQNALELICHLSQGVWFSERSCHSAEAGPWRSWHTDWCRVVRAGRSQGRTGVRRTLRRRSRAARSGSL